MAQTWQFTFTVVMDGVNQAEALSQAYEYLSTQPEPAEALLLEEKEDE